MSVARNRPTNAPDFRKVAEIARRDARAVLRRLLPDGRREGQELVALNPTRPDRRPGSFRVNLRTGRWADFATGDKGGDLVSLVAYLERCPQAEAARLLARMLGMEGVPRPKFLVVIVIPADRGSRHASARGPQPC